MKYICFIDAVKDFIFLFQDVVELLEKRVKSRYSHRSILTFSQIDFEEYISMIRLVLAKTFLFILFTSKVYGRAIFFRSA